MLPKFCNIVTLLTFQHQTFKNHLNNLNFISKFNYVFKKTKTHLLITLYSNFIFGEKKLCIVFFDICHIVCRRSMFCRCCFRGQTVLLDQRFATIDELLLSQVIICVTCFEFDFVYVAFSEEFHSSSRVFCCMFMV